MVYEGGKQNEDKETLNAAIKRAWREISLSYIDSLYNSMKERIYEVITNKGGSTHYRNYLFLFLINQIVIRTKNLS